MMTTLLKKVLIYSLVAVPVFSGMTQSAEQSGRMESLHGFYAREGNNSSSSSTAGNNIYIKFFEDRWIAMLYIPYPYASTVEPAAIGNVFEAARNQVSGSSFIRGRFDQLTELATLQFERYGYLEGQIVFECGSMAPCTIKLGDDYLELIKPGVINEHIVKYEHLASQ